MAHVSEIAMGAVVAASCRLADAATGAFAGAAAAAAVPWDIGLPGGLLGVVGGAGVLPTEVAAADAGLVGEKPPLALVTASGRDGVGEESVCDCWTVCCVAPPG